MTRYYSMKEVAQQLGVTRVTINRYIEKLGLSLPRSRFDRRGYAISEAQLKLLREAIHGGPQPVQVDLSARDITRAGD